ncbi:RidA family protein [Streptomyces sp. NPDC127178]|uniref:RidA family protein n=1 Tax=unclassified Streptomyces TaxID=2593676 RepID=UPI00362E16DB
MAEERHSINSGTEWEALASFSRAVRFGDHIWVSGTTAVGPDGVVGESDPATQMNFIIDKIQFAIIKLGGQLSDVVRTRVFVADIAYWQPVARVHGERFRGVRPANTLVEARLVAPELLVEVEAEAMLGSGQSASGIG